VGTLTPRDTWRLILNQSSQTATATKAPEQAPEQPWRAAVETTIADAVRKNQRVALLYSGDSESSLLLRLAEPWRQHVTVYTVRTGAEFPHMVAFMDRKLEGWRNRVITRDLKASFVELGLPSSVLPIEHTQGVSQEMSINERLPRIVPWNFCCSRNRSLFDWDAFRRDGIGVVVSGQRAGDYEVSNPSRPVAPTFAPDEPPTVVITPLWHVSRADVCKAVKDMGVELPDHYSEYPSALACSVCPAALTTKRRAWMAKRYPERLAVAEKLHDTVKHAVIEALDGDNTVSPIS
jgi:3'-phosphoadenosine 5'-phosphosulfate sulfotransferase (PAPS reductase)/FAD synthetase